MEIRNDERSDTVLATRPYGSLESFLSNAKRTLHSAIISQQRVTIVLGDDSADLDSIVSSLLYAYFKSSSNINTPLTNTSVNRHLPTYQYPPLYIPVINSRVRDLKDRPGVLKILESSHAALKLDWLITLDDLEVEPPLGLNPDNTSSLSPQNTRIMLTGNNKITGGLSPAFNDCIIGFMDNTHDEQISPAPNITNPRISTKAATCTSLIVNRYKMVWYRLSWGGRDLENDNDDNDDEPDESLTLDESSSRHIWDHQMAELAASVVLLATNNLMNKEVTTKADIDAFSHLEEKICNLETRWHRDNFFKELTGMSG